MYGKSPYLKQGWEIEVLNTHSGRVNHMATINRHNSTKLLVSSGSDGTVFVYRVSEAENKNVGSFTRKNAYQLEKCQRMLAQKS